MPLWALFTLVIVGSLAILAEFFIPAFGIIGLGGFVTIVVAVVLGFTEQGDPGGMILLFFALIIGPVVVIGGFKRFPKSVFGKRMILATDEKTAPGPADHGVTVGTDGVATTPLHPSGMATLAGRRTSVVTAGEYLDQGTPVTVITVEGARVVVRRK